MMTRKISDMNERLFVARREDGSFLAIDSHSGGYPWFPDHFGQAEKFEANDRASCVKEGPFTIHELTLGPGMSFDKFKNVARADIRAAALAKLSPAEREALGL